MSRNYNINKDFYITRNDDGSYTTNLLNDENKAEVITKTHEKYSPIQHIQEQLATRKTEITKSRTINRMYKDLLGLTPEQIEKRTMQSALAEDASEADILAHLEENIGKLQRFFSEWQIDVSYRFVDTLLRHPNKKAYTLNYFKLSDNPSYNEIAQKVNGAEYTQILSQFSFEGPVKKNTHLKVYYGPAGTGKTTKACAEADYCIVCSSDMTCKDLLQDFNFDNGKATFQKSDLWKAIEEGKTIVFDEINLLPPDARQFLQGLTDSKKSIDYLGNKINIHPDFKIIGTMNLIVNGMTFPLSEPLVDRCYDIVEFKLTPKDIFKAIIAKDDEDTN